MKALDEQNGSQPSAWMVEAVFEFEFLGRGAAVAAGYQATQEAGQPGAFPKAACFAGWRSS